MREFLSLLSYPFMYRALIVGVLVSLCAALLGVVLVLKKYTLIGHGLGEVGFASLALAVALDLPPMAVSVPLVVLASFLVMYLSQKGGASGDIAIGVMATAALSVGVMITSLSKGSNIDVTSYMFGSILGLTGGDVILSAVLSAVVLAMYILLFNRLFSMTYDEVNARATGINVTLYQFVISFLTAVTVVLGMRMMGAMLISSLIIFPALTARRLSASFRGMVICAAVVSVVCFLAGLIASFYLDLPTGACIVCVNLAALALSRLRRAG